MDISSLQAFQGGAGCNLKPSSFPGGPWLQPQAFMLSKGGPGRNLKPSSFPGGPWLQPQAFKIARGSAGCNLKASSFPGGPWLQPQAFMLFRGGPGRNLKLSSLDPLDSWTPAPALQLVIKHICPKQPPWTPGPLALDPWAPLEPLHSPGTRLTLGALTGPEKKISKNKLGFSSKEPVLAHKWRKP